MVFKGVPKIAASSMTLIPIPSRYPEKECGCYPTPFKYGTHISGPTIKKAIITATVTIENIPIASPLPHQLRQKAGKLIR